MDYKVYEKNVRSIIRKYCSAQDLKSWRDYGRYPSSIIVSNDLGCFSFYGEDVLSPEVLDYKVVYDGDVDCVAGSFASFEEASDFASNLFESSYDDEEGCYLDSDDNVIDSIGVLDKQLNILSVFDCQ